MMKKFSMDCKLSLRARMRRTRLSRLCPPSVVALSLATRKRSCRWAICWRFFTTTLIWTVNSQWCVAMTSARSLAYFSTWQIIFAATSSSSKSNLRTNCSLHTISFWLSSVRMAPTLQTRSHRRDCEGKTRKQKSLMMSRSIWPSSSRTSS